MKHLSVLESAIIGFFVGIVVSAYVLFVDSFGGYIGEILDYVSFRPLINSIQIPGDTLSLTHFAGIVIVYIVYAIIINILVKKSSKALFLIIPLLILLLGGAIFQQVTGSAKHSSSSVSDSASNTSSILVPDIQSTHSRAQLKQNEQYFGNEVSGDLNGDGINDVAFIISRLDADRGMLYYLVSSLATDTGHIGTNLLYLGDKVEPRVISIADGVIDVAYVDHTNKSATSTKHFYAHVNDNKLDQISITTKGQGLYWGSVSLEGETETFKPCESEDTFTIVASSTILSKTHDQIMQVAGTNGSTLPIFGVLIGSVENTAKSTGFASSTATSNKGFILQSVITLSAQGVCP